MEIPRFKNTECAVDFVKENFHKEGALEALIAARKIADALADAKLCKDPALNTSAHAYAEAIEMMNKEEHWRFVWGPLTK